ncbi:hypothetical protein K1719_006132 [Acacia pycnantha]|nr:hypothetical protein K1719_006132 [Acacia pycnantha]
MTLPPHNSTRRQLLLSANVSFLASCLYYVVCVLSLSLFYCSQLMPIITHRKLSLQSNECIVVVSLFLGFSAVPG